MKPLANFCESSHVAQGKNTELRTETALQFWPCLHLAVVCTRARQQCEHRGCRPVNFCFPESEESRERPKGAERKWEGKEEARKRDAAEKEFSGTGTSSATLAQAVI